jgi:hypothetical protein
VTSGRKGLLVAGGAALALVGGGGALALGGGGDRPVTGPEAQAAAAAAVRAVPGGTAGPVERDSDHGAAFDVEVVRNGATIDVWVDASGKVVFTAPDHETESG